MGVSRIVRRNLKRAGEANHVRIISGKKDDNGYSLDVFRSHMEHRHDGDFVSLRVFHKTWVDTRPRDKYGILAGHCSDMAKRVVRISGRKVVGILRRGWHSHITRHKNNS